MICYDPNSGDDGPLFSSAGAGQGPPEGKTYAYIFRDRTLQTYFGFRPKDESSENYRGE